MAQEAHEIISAADCDEALNLFRRESPDLVLLDMNLAALELKALQLLFRAPGRTISSEKLSTHLWGGEGERERHTLKQLIYRLRGKLETAGAAGSPADHARLGIQTDRRVIAVALRAGIAARQARAFLL